MRSSEILWAALRGDPARLASLTISGPDAVLPSRFDVTAFAASAVGVATLAAAELLQARTRSATSPLARVDTVEACAAFRSEALFEPIGWERPPIWDPIAGDYRASDRWIRLHTNYAYHRAAVLRVLGVAEDRSAVAEAVLRWGAAPLESAIVDEGGCAAVMYERGEWLALPHGAATADEPAIALEDDGPSEGPSIVRVVTRPLGGIRVLDLTRVIAGPVCTRFLAAHGAEVLRIDPPGFDEVPAVIPESTAGKRCASLALDTPEGAATFDALLAEADVLVHGLRPGALERLGFDRARLRARNPSLVIATHDAYGWRGPWRGRRGFDSLVQMSTGLAAPVGAGERDAKPSPLPAQALDHGIGYLLAAGVCRALAVRAREGRIATVRGALLGAANHLFALGPGNTSVKAPAFGDVLEEADTAWGRARRVRCPGAIDGAPKPFWSLPPRPLGGDPPVFLG